MPDHDIHLWLAHYEPIVDPHLHAELQALLSDVERAQQQRYHFAADRLRHLVTRAMVRSVLSRYAPVAADEWEFTENAWGRPEIAARHDAAGLCFNLSHAHGLIALAVSRHRALGVDVEHLNRRSPSMGIAERFFSPLEVAALAALPPHLRRERFLAYWTLKESYVKARGMGLSLPLSRFGFDIAGEGAIRLRIDAGLGDDPGRWSFRQWRPTPGYVLALCVEGRMDSIRVRTITPALTDGAATFADTGPC
jgi:4'-phosphopantetheinyl transferase